MTTIKSLGRRRPAVGAAASTRQSIIEPVAILAAAAYLELVSPRLAPPSAFLTGGGGRVAQSSDCGAREMWPSQLCRRCRRRRPQLIPAAARANDYGARAAPHRTARVAAAPPAVARRKPGQGAISGAVWNIRRRRLRFQQPKRPIGPTGGLNVNRVAAAMRDQVYEVYSTAK